MEENMDVFTKALTLSRSPHTHTHKIAENISIVVVIVSHVITLLYQQCVSLHVWVEALK